jgi:hypothetical protein
VADIIRQFGQRFIDRQRTWLTAQHLRVLRAIARCRTAALAGMSIAVLPAAVTPSRLTRVIWEVIVNGEREPVSTSIPALITVFDSPLKLSLICS